MDRRDALKALGSLAAATGISVQPVTASDVERVTMVVLKPNTILSDEEIANLRRSWEQACVGTGLENIKAVVIDGSVDVEFVRR
jgi:hypothetical protein